VLNTLLGKITGFFDKDFLFASFLPALLFAACIGVPLVAAVGIRSTWSWVGSWSNLQKGTVGTGTTVALVVFAYVLQGLRTFFSHSWSGRTNFPPLWLFMHFGKWVERRRFDRFRERSQRLSPWEGVFEDFRQAAANVYGGGRPDGDAPEALRRRLLRRVGRLRAGMGPRIVRWQVQEFLAEYGRYNSDSLGCVYRAIKVKLNDWDELAKNQIELDTVQFDREFGSRATIRATKLGNVIESYNQYSYKRYRIEAEVFWPRLREVIPDDYFKLVEDQRILLDFCLTSASLALVYGALVFYLGPVIWFNRPLWFSLAAVGFTASIFFYRLSVSVADQFGDLVRSSFDLFRLDLMRALGRERPPSLLVERAQWDELSRLVDYADVQSDFRLRPE
jgi:hypothetical protein